MMHKPYLDSALVRLARQCANDLISIAKSTGSAIFLVGHVTKEGIIAGQSLEHMANTVLYFEGEISASDSCAVKTGLFYR
ncbi:MAG: hypothetical protein HS132_02695 [Planctomycetia bacterium]|nr:hypothetical protein [Planctomycetia bacterium]